MASSEGNWTNPNISLRGEGKLWKRCSRVGGERRVSSLLTGSEAYPQNRIPSFVYVCEIRYIEI
jgi:hypothetical protein